MNVVHIVGARPQFIKYFPIAREIEKNKNIKNILVHTGQHYDYAMSDIFFKELKIKEPDYNLNVGSASHGKQTAQIIAKLEDVLNEINADVVVVYGDTNSTLSAAVAAAKLHIPIAHVEAGLRSFNKRMPEEINRVLVDHASTVLFCPTKTAVNNLKKEGFEYIYNNGTLPELSVKSGAIKCDISKPIVINSGDVMYDVLGYAAKIANGRSDIFGTMDLGSCEYNLLTLHRAESTDCSEKFGEIIDFVNKTADGKRVIFPIHPRTEKVYKSITNKKFAKNVEIIKPVSYFDILVLLRGSSMVMTDSGGMQKEAYWLKVPAVTIREETEWVETILAGWNVLYKNYKGKHRLSANETDLYGDGNAAERIVAWLGSML